jgi:hypothetical protein
MLFVIANEDPSQTKPIRTELEKLRGSLEPHWRIAASKALGLMAIGDWIQEARSNPANIPVIEYRLNDLQRSSTDWLKFAAAFVFQKIANFQTNSKDTP